jgi:hypothetical protein
MQIGEVLQEAWEIFKKNPGKLISAYCVFLLINLVAGIVLRLISPIGDFLLYIVDIMVLAGVYYFYLEVYRDERASIFDIFYPIKEYFVRLLIMAFLKIVLISIGFVLFILPGIYLSVSFIFSELLIADKGFKSWGALDWSRKNVTKSWFSYFAFLLVLMFINILGLIPFGLGLLITGPLSLMAIVVAYVQKFYEERDWDD